MSASLLHGKCVATSEKHCNLAARNRRNDGSAHSNVRLNRVGPPSPMRGCTSHESLSPTAVQASIGWACVSTPDSLRWAIRRKGLTGFNRRVILHNHCPVYSALDAHTFVIIIVCAASQLQTQSNDPGTMLPWSEGNSHDVLTGLSGYSFST